MSISYLDDKRFEVAKKKIHLELFNYFTRLNSERRLWCFTRAIRSLAQSRRFTHAQAERLTAYLSRHYGIRKANINTALAFNAFPYLGDKKSQNIIQFKRDCLSNDAFEQRMGELDGLRLEESLEFWQALELTVLILNYYPGCIRRING